MNVQRHERIAQIKTLSGYLFIALTCGRFLCLLTWPLVVIALFVTKNTTGIFNLGYVDIKNADLTLIQRLLLIILISVIWLFVLKVIHHFRELMRHFRQGEIFNKDAIGQARNALFNSLIVFGLSMLCDFGAWIYAVFNHAAVGVSLDNGLLSGGIFFGLMYVLLWALEIGHDLNEESELTI